MRKTICIAAVLVAFGCDPSPTPTDTGLADTGVDAADTGVDAGPCGGACTGATPVCDTTTETCVACLDNTHCAAPTALCDTTSNECVACLGDSDCTADATMPICESGACRACAADADCTAMTATPVCDEPSGRCVECTVDSEETTCPAPDNFACHPTELTCTGAERGSLGFCEACVSDTECGATAPAVARCVPMDFEGSPHGTYCLIDQTTLGAICPNQQASQQLATSVGGVESQYCFVREGISTCEAVTGFGDACPGGSSDCGAPGVDDGYCNMAGTCSYACLGPRDCGGGVPCSGAPTRYCDGP